MFLFLFYILAGLLKIKLVPALTKNKKFIYIILNGYKNEIILDVFYFILYLFLILNGASSKPKPKITLVRYNTNMLSIFIYSFDLYFFIFISFL